MVSQLANGFSPDKILETPPARFNFYDSTFLRVLTQNKVAGRKVFTTLFEKNKASRIFKFLDNESSVREELGILSSLPFWPFFKAGVHELLN